MRLLLIHSADAVCRRQAEKARQEEAAAAAQMEQLDEVLREVRGRVEQRRTDINSQASQGAVVKALMEARQRGEIHGIYGRLGEAGAGCALLGERGEGSRHGSSWCWLVSAASDMLCSFLNLATPQLTPLRRPGCHCQGV